MRRFKLVVIVPAALRTMTPLRRSRHMRQGRLLVMVPLVLAGMLGAGQLHPASAQGLTYDVESGSNYCSGGGAYCFNTATNKVTSGYNYAEADAYNYNHPGSRSGPPDEIFLECDHAFTDAMGVLRYQYGYVDAYVNRNGGNSRGRVGGSAGVVSPGADENNTQAASSENTSGSDPYQGTMGTSNGFQTTNNSTDRLVSGQINIYISGMINNQHYDPILRYFVSDPSTRGQLSCHTTANSVTAFGYTDNGEGEFE